MPTDPAQSLSARIEVFRPGTFTPMEGGPITYSAADLRAIADAYDPETAPAPIVVGHPDVDAPAYGWVESFDYDAGADRLYANLHQIDPAFAELVKAGKFRKVSMQYFGPEQGHNPVPGTWYPKHVGFLGAAAPAVSGLKNVQFAGPAGASFTAAFGEPGFEEAASLFRRLRDFLIDTVGLDQADKTLPSWSIEWLGEAEVAPKTPALAQSYAEGGFVPPAPRAPTPPTTTQKKETAVTQPSDPAFAAREADLDRREAEIAAQAAAIAHDGNVSFAEALVQGGRLLPVLKDKVVAILDALPSTATVSFAAGADKITPAAALREVLEAMPKVVSFGEMDLGDPPGEAKAASFAADGKAVDPERLALHQKAEAYQRANPGTSYIDAVRVVS